MTEDEFAAYRDGRFAELLSFYDSRAIRNKKKYHLCSMYVLVSSLAIAPILAIDLITKNNGTIAAAILAPTVALANGIAAHYKFHDNWLSYRATCDALQRELAKRNASVGPYQNSKDRNALFVERVEDLITKEGSEWYARQATEAITKGKSK